MEEILSKLRALANQSSQICLFQSNVKDIAKGVGRITGKFDSELFDFLKLTNGAKIFDYRFLGFKSKKKGVDMDKYTLDLWAVNHRLAGRFVPFAATSTGENFGYLIDIIDKSGRHPVVYYSSSKEDHLYMVGSSFYAFMETFLDDVQKTLDSSQESFVTGIEDPEWPKNVSHWLDRDTALQNDLDAIHRRLKTFMPDTIVS